MKTEFNSRLLAGAFLKSLVVISIIPNLAYAHFPVVRVKIDGSIRSKKSLISAYSTVLNFPSYCGKNWDGFEECLNDLSWFQRDEHIIVEHHGMPQLSEDDTKIYLDILEQAAQSSKKSDHPIELLFN